MPHKHICEDESKLPIIGVKIVFGTIVGIFVVLRLVGWAWEIYTQSQ